MPCVYPQDVCACVSKSKWGRNERNIWNSNFSSSKENNKHCPISIKGIEILVSLKHLEHRNRQRETYLRVSCPLSVFRGDNFKSQISMSPSKAVSLGNPGEKTDLSRWTLLCATIYYRNTDINMPVDAFSCSFSAA